MVSLFLSWFGLHLREAWIWNLPLRNTSASKQGEMMHTKAAPGHGELESLSPEAIIFSYRDQEKATPE